MTQAMAEALKNLEAQVEAGRMPDTLVVEDRTYSLHYGDDEFGRFVEFRFGWPPGWFGVLEGDTWGGQEAVRHYYEFW